MTSEPQDRSTQAAPVPIWRRSLARLGLVLLVVGTILVIWLALRATLIPYLAQRYTPESFRLLYGEKPKSALPERKKGLPRRGQINGVPISVPLEYMTYYPVEYKDKSIWEGPKSGDKKPEERTYDDAIGAFAIYAHWPDMQPRNPDNWLSFLKRDDGGEHPWMSIGVVDDYARHPRPPESPDNGLARELRVVIEILAKYPRYIIDPTDPGQERRIKAGELRYETRGKDLTTDLLWAEPVGPGTARFDTWNKALYWQGDINGTVTDLIECDNGKLPNPKHFQKCHHKYLLPEWGAYVLFSYPRSWLPQWRELKAGVRQLLLTFQVTPGAAAAPPIFRTTIEGKEAKP